MENSNATNGRERFLRTTRSGDRGVAALRRQNGDNAVREKIRADVALLVGIGINTPHRTTRRMGRTNSHRGYSLVRHL